MKRLFTNIFCLALAAGPFGFVSCSTTSQLPESGHYLTRNKVEIKGEGHDLSSADITPYIKQQPAAYSLGSNEKTVFDEHLIPVSEEKILGHLHYLGYYYASVRSEVEYKKNKARVRYTIFPGDRIRIRQLVYDVPEGEFAGDFYSDTVNVSVRPGDYLSEKSLEAESARSASAMRTLGYYDFSKNNYFFEADTLSGPDSVVLKMQVREYTRNESPNQARALIKSHIGNVSISHPADLSIRDNVLRNLNTIRPGSVFNESDINKTYNRLRYLQLFSGVGIELSQSAPDTVDCSIRLTPSRIQGFKLDFETSTNSSGLIGVSPQLNYYHKNIFHGGERLNLGFLGNFQFRLSDKVGSTEFGVSAGITFPRFLGIPSSYFKGSHIPRTEIKTSYNYQDRPEYTRNIVSASYGYTGRFFDHYFYQFYPLQVNVVNLRDLDPAFYKNLESNPFMRYTYQNHFDSGMGGMLYYSSGTDPSDLEPSGYVRLSGDLSGNIWSLFKSSMPVGEDGQRLLFGTPYTQYARGELTLGHCWRFGRDERRAVALRFLAGAGYAYGNSTALPFEKQFYCGGAGSMRGWQTRSLGPGRSGINTAFSIPSQTGDIKFEANAEYRFGLFWKLEGALFCDMGNVWTINDEDNPDGNFGSDFYKSIAMDWGTGLRANLDFLVVRLDMGIKLFEPSADAWRAPAQWFRRDGFAIHFGVGYPF